MAKLTFSLDEATVEKLRKTATRLRKPQRMVVREAIERYAAEEAKLSDEERERILKVIDYGFTRLRAEAGADLKVGPYDTLNRGAGDRRAPR